MRRIFVILFCLCSLNSFAATKKIVNIQRWTADSGAKVYFVRVPNLPILDLRVIFSAGSAYDKQQLGLALLTNTMIGQGSKQHNANQIAIAFDNIGAQFGTTAGRDMAVVSLRSLTQAPYLPTAISEFRQVLAQARFSKKTLNRVKNQTLAAIKAKTQMPGGVASKAFYNAIYGNHAYAHDPLGRAKDIKRMTAADCRSFYRRYYTARNANIVMVGDIDIKKAKSIANQLSSALPRGVAVPRIKPAIALKHPVYQHIDFPSKQSAILVGQLGITRQDPDYFPLKVGNYLLGGLPLGSILFQQIRDQRGLAYSARSAFVAMNRRGPFVIQVNTRANKTKEALSIVKTVLRNYVKLGPSRSPLNLAKQNMIGSFPLGLASNRSLASIVSIMAFYHLPLDYLDRYVHRVRAMTPKKIKQAFQKAIDPNRLVVITVGPSAPKQ